MLAGDLNEPGQIAVWHRRGALRFSIAIVIMLTAEIVTLTISFAALVTLLSAAIVGYAAFRALTYLGLAERRWSLLLWPLATCSTLGVLHMASSDIGTLLPGLIVLAFQFIGITQPPGTGLLFILPASALLLHLTDMSSRDAVIRLPLAILVWLVVSEVPSRLLGELRDKQRALELLATTDPLTGLLNRSRLEAHLEMAGDSSAVAVIDLDHFKEFNDTQGHISGDRALADFSGVLQSMTRAGDAAFRYGGDEFLVIFPRTTPAEAAEILDRCAEMWDGHGSGLTFSAGIAEGGDDAVRAADGLLYEAKRGGRERVLTVERSLARQA
ncbi:diguanylate cyclase (GGDEF)-like protein [Aeromicrobium panaciterrae]|uniref:Diguanylate cyclase (GGDEF)-like protein n=1 Tax=Aeromicrobium panaciterrae TaxID=363861 RepID=A0ABU1UQM7_9ACTN|nr:GGDEF domain-containing protein [Aeromicrobium panaciterrae]MDR7087483.1 diguanylate cyclase (GGDEF)-like protein [Aeromicrobium panaciterrae]